MKICWNPTIRAGCRTQNRDGARFCMKCGRRLEGVLSLLNCGDVLGERYEVRRVVGTGGAGAVYLVVDRTAGRVERALKESCDAAQHEQFRVVADVLRPLDHP